MPLKKRLPSYEANNKPNNRNRFAHEIKAVNCSIQMMLIQGISKELLIGQLDEWLAIAGQELMQSKIASINEAPTALGIKLLVPELTYQFSEIDTKDDEQMEKIHHQLMHNQKLIFRVLEKPN